MHVLERNAYGCGTRRIAARADGLQHVRNLGSRRIIVDAGDLRARIDLRSFHAGKSRERLLDLRWTMSAVHSTDAQRNSLDWTCACVAGPLWCLRGGYMNVHGRAPCSLPSRRSVRVWSAVAFATRPLP